MQYNYTADLMRIEIRVIFKALKSEERLQFFGYVYLPKMRLSVVFEGRYIGY